MPDLKARQFTDSILLCLLPKGLHNCKKTSPCAKDVIACAVGEKRPKPQPQGALKDHFFCCNKTRSGANKYYIRFYFTAS